jgi:hypothetical protein
MTAKGYAVVASGIAGDGVFRKILSAVVDKRATEK